MPPSIDQQITFLRTNDLKGTARFYEEVLGLPLKLDQGTCRIYQVSSDGYLGFCRQKEEHAAIDPGPVIITLVTQDVDRWYEHLQALGVPFEKPPAINPDYSISHCFLRDPNGYLVEIQRFLHPF
jgi:catechol 2,3-dioxygenase-like lactoylglutathione lyase family enzyme